MLVMDQAGQYIQSRGGVVTAEQLAPYLDVTPESLERVDGSVSEAYMVHSTAGHHCCHACLPCNSVPRP
jgi:hypothetical protein